MSCRRFEDLILEYCEDALSAEDRGCVETHLAGCAECRAFFEIQRQVEAALPGAIGKPEPSPEFRQRLMRRVACESEERSSWVPQVLDVFGYCALAAIGATLVQAWFSPAQLAWIMMGASAGFLWWMSLRLLRES
ncbi:MAG: anti-sigma factor [Bryobacteraceae bacterium]|jgi:anti-sigma factor RsiW